MSDAARAAADRIKAKVSILDVLIAYGYSVRPDGGDREQQFSCDLHGDGRDLHPSARVYPASNHWYCFTCSEQRDVIETVRIKEDIGFWAAVRRLERSLGLEPLAGNDPEEDIWKGVGDDPTKTFEDVTTRVQQMLNVLTDSRDLPLVDLLRFWEGFDKIVFNVKGFDGQGTWSESKGKRMLMALLERIQEA